MLAKIVVAIKKELLLYARSQSECLISVLFFILIAALFPMTLQVSSDSLASLAPGVVWVAALLSIMMALPKVFAQDSQDGSLTQYLLGPMPIPLLVVAKLISHWLVFSVPLILMSPIVGLFFHLSLTACGMLMLSLLIGTPVLHAVGVFVTALTCGLRQSSLLTALILIPLTIPTLIFSTAVAASSSFSAAAVPLLFLAALFTLMITVMPFFAGFALKISVSDR